MNNGERSNFSLYETKDGWSDIKINPVDAVVRKVIVFGRSGSDFGGV